MILTFVVVLRAGVDQVGEGVDIKSVIPALAVHGGVNGRLQTGTVEHKVGCAHRADSLWG